MDEYIRSDDDGMGKTKPDVHLFNEQNESDVLKMFKESQPPKAPNYVPKARPLGENFKAPKNLSIMDAPAHHKPCLIFDDAPPCSEKFDTLPRTDAGQSEKPETMALWRKLAGVRPQENVEAAKELPTIMDTILLSCKRKFASGLAVEWSQDNWNQCLVINGAKTRIRADDLVAALEGLQHITDEDEAVKIVSEVVVKKLERLFI